jgi:hypothetical protein
MNHFVRPTSRHARAGALLLGALLATGCATAKRVPLEESNAQRLKTVRPVATLSQQELKVSIVPSNAGAAFGLIGAIIDTSANNSAVKTAEAKVVPVRNALIGWEAGDALLGALGREVAPVAILKASKIEIRQVPSVKDALAGLLQETQQDALFLVETDYRLSPTFDRMIVTVQASLLPARLTPTQAEKAAAQEGGGPTRLYENRFVSSALLPGFVPGKTTMDEAAALWAADGGRKARRALDDGIDEVARMLAFDIVQVRTAGAPAATYAAPEGAPSLVSIGPFGFGALTGFPVKQEKGRAWLRVSTGELAAVEAK